MRVRVRHMCALSGSCAEDILTYAALSALNNCADLMMSGAKLCRRGAVATLCEASHCSFDGVQGGLHRQSDCA